MAQEVWGEREESGENRTAYRGWVFDTCASNVHAYPTRMAPFGPLRFTTDWSKQHVVAIATSL